MNRRTSALFSSAAHAAAIAALMLALAACVSVPPPVIQRNPNPPPVASQSADADAMAKAEPLPENDGKPQAQIRRGNGQTINRAAASSSPPDLGATTGEARFNFEGESLHAVVKVILGDMLGQNYVIAPDVQGTVTYSTPKPVSPAQAMSVLQMILGWNGATMIYGDGRYSIVRSDQALATGVVTPRTGSAQNARGFESRVVQLKFISATEMEKLLKPYARDKAIVNVDSGRNLITVAGNRAELENYLRTIEIFDVDWMASMSVGVFPVQSSKATKVVQDLEKVFGEQSKSPIAGMFRFMPLEGANAVLAITPQPKYLDDIQQWIERIDGAGQGVKLHSYQLKYITAKDLSQRLADVFGSRGGSGGAGNDYGGGASVIPGSAIINIDGGGGKDGGYDSSGINPGGGSGGIGGGSGGGFGGGSLSLDPRQGSGNVSASFEVGADKVGVSAIEENNTLLVRCSAVAWRSILEVIEKLDVMPLQVHIEAQVVQVKLGGKLEYGVNWFLENEATANGFGDVTSRGTDVPRKWSSIGASIGGRNGPGLAWTLIKNDAVAVITALDSITDTKLLQTPSIFVRNNQEATLNVGDRIPVVSTSVNPVLGNSSSVSQVQYLDTGTILKVRPRATPDGTVFMDLVQEISTPTATNANGNRTINTNRLKTSAVAQSGDTILLAGLITDRNEKGSDGLPGLSRIPVIGGLFGKQTTDNTRSEIIILITPTLVESTRAARDFTDDYSRRFRAMEPLHAPKSAPKR